MTLVSGNTRYNVYVDIRGVSLEMGRQTTVWLSKTAIFSTASGYFFKSFTGKANNILYSVSRADIVLRGNFLRKLE